MITFFENLNRWHSPYEYTTDANGVEWMHRKDANGDLCGKPIKANDPNFVQGTVPTPQFAVLGTTFQTLNVIAATIILICALLLGSTI